jgi:hypothetical protein
MIHLFKKVYVATDKVIDISADRVVISAENGVPVLSAIETYAGGYLIMHNTSTSGIVDEAGSWEEFFVLLKNWSNEKNVKVIIYCDDKAIVELLCAWFNSLLPNSTEDSVKKLIKGIIFRYNVFGATVRTDQNRSSTLIDINVDETFSAAYASSSNVPALTNSEITDNVGVEFLLATYLATGNKKEELKTSLKPLIRKDLDKYMLEVREIFFVHCLTRRFRDAMGFGAEITYDNISELLNDTSKYGNAMLNGRVWNYKYMSIESANSSAVNLEAMTAGDIQDIKDFTVLAGSQAFGWPEEAGYIGVKSDVSKLDFFPIFTSGEFTDEMLTLVLETEATFQHAAGSFFSIDLESVNHYLIEELLERNNQGDTAWISQYSLV